MENWWVTNWWVSALVLLVVVAGLIWLVLARRSTDSTTARPENPQPNRATTSAASSETTHDEAEPRRLPRAAIVVNPTKFDKLSRVRHQATSVCTNYGWAEPLWLETTESDPGTGQTKQALAEGVDLICALGGDGTVRTVASAMVGTDVPLGLLSGGTGNLLARNLGLPVTSLAQGLTVALTGRDARIDTVDIRMTLVPDDDQAEGGQAEGGQTSSDEEDAPNPATRTEEHTFLVMAGLGFDAEVMAHAPEGLKKRVGWAAYLVSGLQRLRGPQFKLAVRTDAGTRLNRRVRSIVIGNVGKLTGGVNLLPDAAADDGKLDVVLLSPEGIVGWGAVVTRLVTRSSRGHQRVDYYSCESLEVTADRPVEVQLDGDTLGRATALEVRVNPASLVVRRS